MDQGLSRRAFLGQGLALGCSAAASPLLTPVTFASVPGEARLVVIILRGAMDGLDIVQPYGDRDFAALRPTLKAGEAAGAVDLDGFHALHPGLSPLMPMWQAGELGFAHAVSTPYRDKRSHFDGQDLLEAGTGFGPAGRVGREGWLNRMLSLMPGAEAETAFAIGQDPLLVLEGAAPVANWWPESRLDLTPATRQLLHHVSRGDPLYRAALDEALSLSEGLAFEADAGEDSDSPMMGAMPGAGGKTHLAVARFAAERLRQDTRIAAFSIGGWDTHSQQARALRRPLGHLAETLLTLRDGLGPHWGTTVVLAMTEFGRTARENGTRGTDHGTGGAMVLAGGALRGGQVWADWPGLAEADLYQRRDLMPTEDVRAYAANVMGGLFGLGRRALEEVVFPGLRLDGGKRLLR